MDAEHGVYGEEGECEGGVTMRDNYMIGAISSQAAGSKMDLLKGRNVVRTASLEGKIAKCPCYFGFRVVRVGHHIDPDYLARFFVGVYPFVVCA